MGKKKATDGTTHKVRRKGGRKSRIHHIKKLSHFFIDSKVVPTCDSKDMPACENMVVPASENTVVPACDNTVIPACDNNVMPTSTTASGIESPCV